MKTRLYHFIIVFAIAHSAFGQGVRDAAKIEVYITPYYNSTGPEINIGPFSKGLEGTTEPEFVATIAKMKQSWPELRFPEMYVAAIRLYDFGFRNEATYWFYSAQYRSRLFCTLVDQAKMGSMGAPGFELFQAANAFQQLVGPYVNGYAFGDIARLIEVVERVQKENKTVPDMEKLHPGIAFKSRSDWAFGNTGLNDGLTKFVAMLKEQRVAIKKQRVDNGTEAKFSKIANKELPGVR